MYGLLITADYSHESFVSIPLDFSICGMDDSTNIEVLTSRFTRYAGIRRTHSSRWSDRAHGVKECAHAEASGECVIFFVANAPSSHICPGRGGYACFALCSDLTIDDAFSGGHRVS